MIPRGGSTLFGKSAWLRQGGLDPKEEKPRSPLPRRWAQIACRLQKNSGNALAWGAMPDELRYMRRSINVHGRRPLMPASNSASHFSERALERRFDAPQRVISIKGARAHNLKGVDLTIP